MEEQERGDFSLLVEEDSTSVEWLINRLVHLLDWLGHSSQTQGATSFIHITENK